MPNVCKLGTPGGQEVVGSNPVSPTRKPPAKAGVEHRLSSSAAHVGRRSAGRTVRACGTRGGRGARVHRQRGVMRASGYDPGDRTLKQLRTEASERIVTFTPEDVAEALAHYRQQHRRSRGDAHLGCTHSGSAAP